MHIFYAITLFCYICLAIVNFAFGNTSIDLADKKWLLRNHELNISVLANIPGSVYTDLLENGIIKDPYVGYRDDEYAWIADKSWSYITNFRVPSVFLKKYARITFYGVDTIAEISLNKNVLGKTDNMFSTKSYYVTPYLLEDNFLEIRFISPTLYAKDQSERYFIQYGYHVPPRTLPAVQHGRNSQNFIRKEQCSFSWDWGPSFPTVGIWRDATISIVDDAILDDVLVHTIYSKNGNVWNVQFEIIVQSYVVGKVIVQYGFDGFKQRDLINIEPGLKKISLIEMIVPEHSISLWWPRGYGNQTLYKAMVTIINPENIRSISSKEVTFGFRTIELIQEPIEHSEGLSFFFKINTLPIFLKGANWIPADSFQERVTSVVLENLFQSSIDANINTLRVWGGGVYEQDRFYELADELGILIWQDLMFAVALYPVNDRFLESVREEIQSQVRRMQHHPSIIAWSGNNENEAAIAQTWWDEVKTNRKQLVADYVKLYVDTIQPIMNQEDWTRPFVTSSPSNGVETEKVGYIDKNPQNPLYGDVHFYDYKKDCWNSSMFPNPRFASEYGYQSYPSFITMAQIASMDDLKWNSSLMFHRQHHANGNEEIESFIKQHYNLPSMTNEQKYFQYMIYLSQIVQATCVKYESEHYRRLQGNLINGTGHTMGALYWQLNDIWQAPSWASIEYGGRWKMLHYYVQRFFNAIAVTGYIQDDQIFVYCVRDHPEEPIFDMILNIKVYKWDTFRVLWTESIDVERSDKAVVLIFKKNVRTLCDDWTCFVKLRLVKKNSEEIISESDVFLKSFSEVQLTDPKIQIVSITQVKKLKYEIKLYCNHPAAFTWLETTVAGRFSDNGFLMAEQNKSVTFYAWQNSLASTLGSSLKVISLYDAYRSGT